jgi:hypothetical protein
MCSRRFFETLKNPPAQGRGFFVARGYIRPHATTIYIVTSLAAVNECPLHPQTHLRRKIISATSSCVGAMSDCKLGGQSSIGLHEA